MVIDLARLVTPAAWAIVILNLVDLVFTLVWVDAGVASEGNPLMAALLGWHPIGFVATKLGVVSLGVLALWKLRERRPAIAGLVGTAGVYVALTAYHLSAAHRLV